MLVQLVRKPRNVHKKHELLIPLWCINHSESDFQTVSRLNFLDPHNYELPQYKLEFIGWFDSYIFLQAEPFILKDADLKKQPSFHRYVFFFSKGCFFLSSCFHTANTCFNFRIWRGQQTCRKISLGRWAQLCRTVWNAQRMGPSGLHHRSGRFPFSRVVGCISVKTNDLLVAGVEGFPNESHEMFFNMFWAVKRYDGSFFCHKRCGSYFKFQLCNVD